MTQFAPKSLCEQLQKMGCVSESRHWYFENGTHGYVEYNYASAISEGHTPLFFQNDFTGATSLADENCKKVWGEGFQWMINKTDMIQCHTLHHELWFDFLKRTMRAL